MFMFPDWVGFEFAMISFKDLQCLNFIIPDMFPCPNVVKCRFKIKVFTLG